MRAGKLDRFITIERETETVAPSGAISSAWTNFATVRAELVQLSASDFLSGFGEGQTASVIFRIRYLPGITMADRVIYDSAAYGLQEVAEMGRKRGLELRAVRQ